MFSINKTEIFSKQIGNDEKIGCEARHVEIYNPTDRVGACGP